MAGLLLCVALLALSAAAHAGELFVRVTDVLGHRLENIAVSIEPAGDPKDQKKARPSKPSLIRRTDKLGRFRFVRIQPGSTSLGRSLGHTAEADYITWTQTSKLIIRQTWSPIR